MRQGSSIAWTLYAGLLACVLYGAILLVPVLHCAGVLSFGLLVVIVFAIGGLFGPYVASQRVVLAEIVTAVLAIQPAGPRRSGSSARA